MSAVAGSVVNTQNETIERYPLSSENSVGAKLGRWTFSINDCCCCGGFIRFIVDLAVEILGSCFTTFKNDFSNMKNRLWAERSARENEASNNMTGQELLAVLGIVGLFAGGFPHWR